MFRELHYEKLRWRGLVMIGLAERRRKNQRIPLRTKNVREPALCLRDRRCFQVDDGAQGAETGNSLCSPFCSSFSAGENSTGSPAYDSGRGNEESRGTHDLSHNIGVHGAPDGLLFGETLRIGIQHQLTTFHRTTAREIRAVTFLQEVERLTPNWHPRKGARLLAPAIDENEVGAAKR